MTYTKLTNEFGGVYEVGDIKKDNRETWLTSNGWKLQYFLTYRRVSDKVSLEGVADNGYTGVITNGFGEVITVFFAHRKFFMIEYLKELSGSDNVISYEDWVAQF